jgi:hypothetical protein
MWSHGGDVDTPIGSHKEGSLLVRLEGQSGAEGDEPEAQGRADVLQDPKVARELVRQAPPVRVSNPVAQDQGGYIVGNKWVHLPVPFCEAPV